MLLLRWCRAGNCRARREIHDEPLGDLNIHFDTTEAKRWKSLATMHGSTRIVRRGTVDPESRIRESGYRIVWSIHTDDYNEANDDCHDSNDSIPNASENAAGTCGLLFVF